MMGCYFTGDVQALVFSFLKGFDAFFGRDVAGVIAVSNVLNEFEVADELFAFASGRNADPAFLFVDLGGVHGGVRGPIVHVFGMA